MVSQQLEFYTQNRPNTTPMLTKKQKTGKHKMERKGQKERKRTK